MGHRTVHTSLRLYVFNNFAHQLIIPNNPINTRMGAIELAATIQADFDLKVAGEIMNCNTYSTRPTCSL
jgi:hypothetical protein